MTAVTQTHFTHSMLRLTGRHGVKVVGWIVTPAFVLERS